jgi:sugar lactone lactonase YvrE
MSHLYSPKAERRSGSLRTVEFALFAAFAAALAGPSVQAQTLNYTTPYTITTFAGTAYVPGDTDGVGTLAVFYDPAGVALDPSGNLIVADNGNDVIRKITPAGDVTTIAGQPGLLGFGSTDGVGSNAQFTNPTGVACDASGNYYVSDSTNATIRKLTPSTTGGVTTYTVTTIAGNPGITGVADGTGSSATFNNPVGLAVDSSGNIFVADELNDTIRKVTQAGVVTTVAGVGTDPGIADGTGSIAKFNQPYGITIDSSGNFFIADTYNFEIRKMTSGYTVTTIAGHSKQPGSADGTGSNAHFSYPTSVAVDGSGDVFVADYNNFTIRKVVASSGVVTTYAGQVGVYGFSNGNGTAAEFEDPFYIAANAGGTVYVSDVAADLIKVIAPGGAVTTFAGTPFSGFLDGTGSAAQFQLPGQIAVDSSGNVYVADVVNNTIRKITPAGVTTTLAGTPGNSGSADGTGSNASFYNPTSVVVDSNNNVFVADSTNDTIRKITPGGVVSTFAGTAKQGGSTNSPALFNNPAGLAIDSNNNLYVSEAGNYDIRKITSGGVVSTFAGNPGTVGSADGTGSSASFGGPDGMACDSSGNLFVADFGSDTIRKITPAGVVTTFVGTVSSPGAVDGTGTSAVLWSPAALAIDSHNNIFVADRGNDLIRMITSAGVVSTVAGQPYATEIVNNRTVVLGRGSADGTGSSATFWYPDGIAVDANGNLYIADSNNDTIRKGFYSTSPRFAQQPSDQFVTPGGSATFTVNATGAGTLTYQWNFNGTPIVGATSSSYTVTNAQAGTAGQYTVTVTNAQGSSTSTAGTLFVNLATSAARLVNISTRAVVGTGGNILIPGLVISGTGSETLLFRAAGPVLTSFGVSGALAQPTLTVTRAASGSTPATDVATNTGWGTNANASEIASVSSTVGAFALPAGSADCALLVTLQPGAYTVEVSGVGGTTGVALAEVYEVSSSGPRLVNISTRAQDGTGGNVIIPGFVVSGTGNEELLIRGVGPTLTNFGVGGALANPVLTVFDSHGTVIDSNTAWGTGPNAAEVATVASQVGAFALANGSADSADVITLTSGVYTFSVVGASNTTGVALAEVYEVPAP